MEQKYYINFKEESGEIWKLTNVLDTSTPYVEIDKETMREFAEERKKLDDYIVIPSSDEGLKYEIKFRHKDLSEFDVDKSIHHLPKVTEYDTNNAFVITQNLKKGIWTISLTENLRDLLTSTLYYKDKHQTVYITKKDNPNILLDTIDIKFYNVLYTDSYDVPEKDPEIAKDPNVSLYCGKVFENYFHMQENE